MKNKTTIFFACVLSMLALSSKADTHDHANKIYPRDIKLKILGSNEERTLRGLVTPSSFKLRDTPLNIVTLRGALRLNKLSQQGIENIERTLLIGIDELIPCTITVETCDTVKIGGYAEMVLRYGKEATIYLLINADYDELSEYTYPRYHEEITSFGYTFNQKRQALPYA